MVINDKKTGLSNQKNQNRPCRKPDYRVGKNKKLLYEKKILRTNVIYDVAIINI